MMKTKYKFIHFTKKMRLNDRWDIWGCYNNKNEYDQLGKVEYYPSWKQHIFIPTDLRAVFNKSCLDDISHFINQLNNKES